MNMLTEQYENLQVVYPKDCGNAPKRILLKDLAAAAVQGKTGDMTNFLSDDIVCTVVGHSQINGKDSLFEKVQQISKRQPDRLELNYVITHGKMASVEGRVTYENHNQYNFGLFVTFSSAGKKAKINSITVYLIKPNEPTKE